MAVPPDAAAELAEAWRGAFFGVLEEAPLRDDLREAALSMRLAAWTDLLTGAVIESCGRLGLAAAGKGEGRRLDLLPQARNEYLGLDVVALAARSGKGGPIEGPGRPWLWPAAVFELENSRDDDRVAYSLWKVLCVRAPLRVVFAYRPDWEQAAALPGKLAESVVGSLDPEERRRIGGEVLVVMGSRDAGATFPWGYFRFWRLEWGISSFVKLS
jgi:hypothetical protein